MAAEDLALSICHAAERFCVTSNICLTRKRLLKEFLAHPGPDGKTLSGLVVPGHAAAPGPSMPDLLYIVRKWMGFHIIKHYYIMRQYKEASEVVLAFLKFIKTDTTLPPAMRNDLDAALEQIAEAGVLQLPGIFRIIKQPCALNEAWSYVYQLQEFPLAMTPCSAEVSPSRSQQLDGYGVLLAPAARRPAAGTGQPQKTKTNTYGSTLSVQAVKTDSTVVFKQKGGSKRFNVKLSSKRAADLLPGMLVMATIVELSDGSVFMTDWGYTYPTYYAPVADHQEDFGSHFLTPLVY
eukprot:gene7001-7215_t